jgi:hypothetical protein
MKPALRRQAPSRTALPRNIRTSLISLAIGHSLKNGAAVSEERYSRRILELFDRLDAEGIEWVMVGAQAVNLYLVRPRATMDVDIVVRQKHLRKAKKVLREICGAVEDSEVHFRGILEPDPARLEVDVIKSQSHVLFEEVLDRRVEIDGVPAAKLEVLLALKYLSAVSPWRRVGDKHQDVSDFIKAFQDNRVRIDRALLVELASKAHRGARKEFEKFLDAVENGKPITI